MILADTSPVTSETDKPQCFVKAAWRGRKNGVQCLISGNIDPEPRPVQEAVLRAMDKSIKVEAERLGITL